MRVVSELTRRLGKSLCFAAVCYFVGRYVVARLGDVRGVHAPNWLWMAAACGLALSAHAVSPYGLQLLVRGHGCKLTYRAALAVTNLPTLGKYVPGKVWSLVGALHLYRRLGVPRPVALTCLALASVTGILAGTLVALLFGGLVNPQWGGPWPALALCATLVTASAPPVLYPVLNRLLKVLGRAPIGVRLRTPQLVGVTAVGVLCLTLYGCGFACLVRAFTPIGLAQVPQLIGLFAFAQVAGLLAFFAPAGIGVREGALVVGLASMVGAGPAIVITAACRLWQTAMELSLTFASALVFQSLRSAQPPAQPAVLPSLKRAGAEGIDRLGFVVPKEKKTDVTSP